LAILVVVVLGLPALLLSLLLLSILLLLFLLLLWMDKVTIGPSKRLTMMFLPL
jgi:hypothetical protein